MNYSNSIISLSKKLHWLKIAEDEVLEFYLDNQMLQTFRMCEARFFEDYVEGYQRKGNAGRIWFLDFGSVVHKAIELYYKDKKNNFNLNVFIGQLAAELWTKFDMDYWADVNLWKGHKYNAYKELGGFLGFSSLLLQYVSYYQLENERFRTIGTELFFGKNKEVPLSNCSDWSDLNFEKLPFRLYLCGKLDILIDDGFSIGPMDHKTSRDFMGKNPSKMYEIQDGMTGYVFAAQKILKADDRINRQCNKIWMNFIQVKAAKSLEERFKRIPIYKTDLELEEYRQRQISTAARIYQLLENYREDRTGLRPTYNTMVCTNWMHRECPYQSVHRQNSIENQLMILNADFTKNQAEIWNPEEFEN